MHESLQPLMDYALRLLGQRSYTVARLREKLVKRNQRLRLSSSDIDSVIARLIELKYLDDHRFCEQFVRSRCRLKPRGKRLMNLELRQRGVSDEVLKNFWETLELDEHDLANRVLEHSLKRYGRFSGYSLKQKCFQSLSSKGFPFAVIKDVIDKTISSP